VNGVSSWVCEPRSIGACWKKTEFGFLESTF
jgi:hypothetical protein